MVGLVLGLMCGAGIMMVASALKTPAGSGAHRDVRRSSPWTRDLAGSAAWACSLGFLALLLTGLPVLALVSGLFGIAMPRLIAGRRQRSAARIRRGEWPVVMDDLVSSVRAGMSVPEALAELGRSSNLTMAPSFARFATSVALHGRVEDALKELARELDDPVADRLVAALITARSVGGHEVGAMLRTFSELLREDARLRGEIESRQSWTINGARVAVAAPWLVLVLMSMRPENRMAYASAGGTWLIATCAAICALAYVAMQRIARLPREHA